MAMEGDDRFGVVQQGRHIDLPGFDINFVNSAGPDDMNPDYLMLAIERDDSKLLHRFGLEIKEVLEDIITNHGAGDLKSFQIISLAFGTDLFEGVNVNAGKRHGDYSIFGFCSNYDLTL